jgi:hypothetical protein
MGKNASGRVVPSIRPAELIDPVTPRFPQTRIASVPRHRPVPVNARWHDSTGIASMHRRVPHAPASVQFTERRS